MMVDRLIKPKPGLDAHRQCIDKRSHQIDVMNRKHIKFILIIFTGPEFFDPLITVLN